MTGSVNTRDPDRDRARGIAEQGLILRTDDGGATWQDQESGVAINLYAVAAPRRDQALVAGEQGRVLQTKDGGQTWVTQPTITSASLFAVAYRGGTAAWVAGRGGAILKRIAGIATVSNPKPGILPVLRGKTPLPKLSTPEPSPALPGFDDDIPRAVPPPPVRKPNPTL